MHWLLKVELRDVYETLDTHLVHYKSSDFPNIDKMTVIVLLTKIPSSSWKIIRELIHVGIFPIAFR